MDDNSLKDILISYPDSYDVEDANKLIEEIIKAQTVQIGEKMEKYLKKKLAKKMIDKREAEELKEILLEIDAQIKPVMPPTEEELNKDIEKEKKELGEAGETK
jgi:hypothetical protein